MPNGGTKTVSLSYTDKIGINIVEFIPYAEFIVKLNADLDKAEELMLSNDPAVTKGLKDEEIDIYADNFLEYRRFRMNIHALKGLKARVALYLGDKETAKKYATEIVETVSISGDREFQLTGQTDIGKGYLTMPSETLFSMSKSGLSQYLTDYRLTAGMMNSLFGLDIVDDLRAINLWEGGSSNNYILKKYSYPSNETVIKPTGHHLVPMIRVAEMYLILIELSPIDIANKYYKELLLSRNIVKNQTIIEANRYELLKKEYAKELYAEGQMFYFYKRNAATTMDIGHLVNNLDENKYVVPLPDSELGMLNK